MDIIAATVHQWTQQTLLTELHALEMRLVDLTFGGTPSQLALVQRVLTVVSREIARRQGNN